MRLRGALRSQLDPSYERALALTVDEYLQLVTFAQNNYLLTGGQTSPGQSQEEIDDTFLGFVRGAYKQNGVVFACILARMLLFSQARFQFQAIEKGRPGQFFGTPDLRILERPEPGKTTGWMLTRAEQDISLAGNWYGARRASRQGPTLKRMRPDWVTIIIGSMTDDDVLADDIDAEVIGYAYHPGGRHSGRKPQFLLREEVAHYAPIPDPEAQYRGMSWLQPVVAEVMADKAATSHKLRFFEKGATPNLIVKFDPTVKAAAYHEWIKLFREEHEGVANAYKTLFLGAGADVTVAGANLRQIDFKNVQGAGETRIASAGGVPPIIVGLSEGLEAATYSNYQQARRRFADGTMRPLWDMFAAAVEVIVPPPRAATRLWYDDRDISFLQEDERDAADIVLVQSQAMRMLVDGGFTPDSVIQAVTAGDLALLTHSQLLSVQLQAPGQQIPPTNGNGQAQVEAASRLLESINRARRMRELPQSTEGD